MRGGRGEPGRGARTAPARQQAAVRTAQAKEGLASRTHVINLTGHRSAGERRPRPLPDRTLNNPTSRRSAGERRPRLPDAAKASRSVLRYVNEAWSEQMDGEGASQPDDPLRRPEGRRNQPTSSAWRFRWRRPRDPQAACLPQAAPGCTAGSRSSPPCRRRPPPGRPSAWRRSDAGRSLPARAGS